MIRTVLAVVAALLLVVGGCGDEPDKPIVPYFPPMGGLTYAYVDVAKAMGYTMLNRSGKPKEKNYLNASKGPRLGEEDFLRKLPLELLEFPKPVIAAINGAAIGVGVTMVLPCDVRIAAEGAKIGLTFVKLGILPGLGSTHLLPRLVGMAKAQELVPATGASTWAMPSDPCSKTCSPACSTRWRSSPTRNHPRQIWTACWFPTSKKYNFPYPRRRAATTTKYGSAISSVVRRYARVGMDVGMGMQGRLTKAPWRGGGMTQSHGMMPFPSSWS